MVAYVRSNLLRARTLGSAMALAFGAGTAVAGQLLVDGWAVAWVGVPVAGLAGWWLGPRATRGGGALRMALICTVGGAILVGILIAASAALAPYGPDLAPAEALVNVVGGGVVLGIIGILVFGLPALVVLIPIAFGWQVAVRLLSRRLPRYQA